MDDVESGPATDGEALEGASASAARVVALTTDLTVPERTLAWWRTTHDTRGSYYSPLSPFSDLAMTNTYDGVPLLFSARNPKLASQVYASPDNGVTWEAMRGPEQAGERESMAPLAATPLDDGTDYEPHEEQWHPGFVFLETDHALIADAIAHPGESVTAPARAADSLKITTLSDAPDAPVTVGQPATPAEPAQPVALTPEAHAETKSWLARLESRAAALGHAADAELNAGIAALRKLLGHR